MVKSGDRLEYLIRFQNTGTDTAFTVVIKDTLSTNLDLNSINMGASSHHYTWEVHENVLIINFNNIMLPDSNKSEQNSHGFIKFKINPKANITYKDLISNRAAIYFDYNEPVITNQVWLNKNIVSSSDEMAKNIDFQLFPNPVDDILNLVYQNEMDGNTSIVLLNMQGQVLLKKEIAQKQNSIDISSFPKGVYLVQLKYKNNINTKKFVKM